MLVTAAAGGVGSIAVQLAKAAGAGHLIALASSPKKLALARTLGADDGIDNTRSDWPAQVREITKGAGADMVYDLIGGTMTIRCVEALLDGGELVFAALGRFDLGSDHLGDMMMKNQSVRGFALLPWLSQRSIRDDLAHLFELVLTGSLTCCRARAFSLSRLPKPTGRLSAGGPPARSC